MILEFAKCNNQTLEIIIDFYNTLSAIKPNPHEDHIK